MSRDLSDKVAKKDRGKEEGATSPLRRRTLELEALEPRVLLTMITVNSWADNLIPGDGYVTLREAVIAANTDGTTDLGHTGSGADEIVFTPDLAGQTITLGGQDIDITSDLTITGLGANQLTISGNNTSRIFYINDGDRANLAQVG